MKKWILPILALLLVFTGCQKSETPTDVVKAFFTAYQANDRAKVQELLVDPEKSDPLYDFNADSGVDKQIIEKARNFTYADSGVETIEENDATVTISMDYPNVAGVFTSILDEAMAKAATDANADPDELMKWLEEELQVRLEGDLDKVTKDVNIKLKKVEDKWKIDLENSTELLNALMGDLLEMMGQ